MTRLLLALVLLIFAAPAAAQDRIDRLFTDYLARERIPGAVLVVLRDGRPAINRSWGLERPPRPQPIYSISKQFTAATILRLAEQRRVDLDAPVGRYLPAWFADEPTMAVRHLLNHTSGLANLVGRPEVRAVEQAVPGTGSMAEMLDIVDRLPRRFAPGARHAYSNSNFTALALIVERVAGQSFREAQRALLLDPLGLADIDECAVMDRSRLSPGHDMSGATAGLPPNLVPSFTGNGGLCATAEALARWTHARGSGQVAGRDLRAGIDRAPPVGSGYRPPYGFGLSTLPLAGRPAFSHAGAGDGWGAWAAFLPEERITIVILTNRGWVWSTDLGVPMVRILTELEPPAPLRRTRLNRRERATLTGEFEDGLFEITLRVEPDRLILTNPAFGDPIPLWRQPDGRFVSPDRPDTFSLRLTEGRIEFDWMEHRSYLVRIAIPAARSAAAVHN